MTKYVVWGPAVTKTGPNDSETRRLGIGEYFLYFLRFFKY
jgi:hypothetical protein